MSLETAKSILSSYNLLDQQQIDKKRKPKNEFQAYAYRLANDLRDLDNLQIYMRLAKNVERSLMERAYSFVSDSTSKEKGKLFLWKLKLLRQEIEKRKNINNFSYDYVLNNMKIFRNALSKNMIEKADDNFNKDSIEMFNKLIVDNSKDSRKVKNLLLIGNSSKKLVNLLLDHKLKITTFDTSSEINKIIKNSIKSNNNLKKIKILTKDFLKNKCKDNIFDYIIIHNYWQIIPRDSEVTFLKEILRVSKNLCKLIINIKNSTTEVQKWGEFAKNKNETISYFTKSSNKNNLNATLSKFDYKLIESHNINEIEYLNLDTTKYA